jgi:hypothetical protein
MCHLRKILVATKECEKRKKNKDSNARLNGWNRCLHIAERCRIETNISRRSKKNYHISTTDRYGAT